MQLFAILLGSMIPYKKKRGPPGAPIVLGGFAWSVGTPPNRDSSLSFYRIHTYMTNMYFNDMFLQNKRVAGTVLASSLVNPGGHQLFIGDYLCEGV